MRKLFQIKPELIPAKFLVTHLLSCLKEDLSTSFFKRTYVLKLVELIQEKIENQEVIENLKSKGII